MLGWVITGAVFMLKPGYGEAYAPLTVKTYPIEASSSRVPGHGWLEMKLLRTVLGRHLLVVTEETRIHLHPDSGAEFTTPDDADLIRLIDDATSHNINRYGTVESLSNNVAHTSSGVEITVNWQTLSLQQTGDDTRLINQLYKIHYLQWTASESVNKILAIVGLSLLLSLTLLGIRLIVRM